MDAACKWRSLPSAPDLKHLTALEYGQPREQQRPALQELTRAHIESFNYAVGEGLQRAVQVKGNCGQRRTGGHGQGRSEGELVAHFLREVPGPTLGSPREATPCHFH